MNTFRLYVTTPGRPAEARPASRNRPAAVSSRSNGSPSARPRACSNVSASVASRATPRSARVRARRSAESEGIRSSEDGTLLTSPPPFECAGPGGLSDVGDADACMGLVAAVDRDPGDREGLDPARGAPPAPVDAPPPRQPGRGGPPRGGAPPGGPP